MVMGDLVREVDVAVIGGGPGGYSAAFRCAELGLETVVVDTGKRLGGACLFEGCIPSKALLHVAAVLGEAERAKEFGVDFGEPRISLDPLRKWKSERVIGKLARGLASVARGKNVEVVGGRAVFEDCAQAARAGRRAPGHSLQARHRRHRLPAGSAARPHAGQRPHPRLHRRAGAPRDPRPPARDRRRLHRAGAGPGLRRTRQPGDAGRNDGRAAARRRPRSRAAAGPALREGLRVHPPRHPRVGPSRGRRHDPGARRRARRPRSIASWSPWAAGRRPRGWASRRRRARLTERGFIEVDERGRTADPHVWAVGDATGEPMLAHRAMRQGKVVAEAIAGRPVAFDNVVIPAVVFTDPEIAWCGLTETAAAAAGQAVKVARFPWAASGRAATLGRSDGAHQARRRSRHGARARRGHRRPRRRRADRRGGAGGGDRDAGRGSGAHDSRAPDLV